MEDKKTARARAQLRRAQEAQTARSRALSLYNGLGVLTGFEQMAQTLDQHLEPEAAQRFLAYVTYYTQEGDAPGAMPPAPDETTLQRLQEALAGMLEKR